LRLVARPSASLPLAPASARRDVSAGASSRASVLATPTASIAAGAGRASSHADDGGGKIGGGSSRRRRGPLAPPPRAVRADAEADASATTPQLLQAIAEITATVDARVAAALEASAAQAAQAAAEAGASASASPASSSGPGASASSSQGSAQALRARVEASVLHLQRGLLERETEVRLMLLAALCGEHLLLLGPPGTAKSELSRRLSGLLGGQQGADGTAGGSDGENAAATAGGCAYFERLLTRFSVPEELFGPLSMKGLENDQYVRQTAGYLPTAEVAFVDGAFWFAFHSSLSRGGSGAARDDGGGGAQNGKMCTSVRPLLTTTPAETPPPPQTNLKSHHSITPTNATEIFKANSAILNALLTLLNERLFDNGNERSAVPLLTLVGASNELPESEELDALYDRFLLRRQVSQVSTGSAAGLARLAAGRDEGGWGAAAAAAPVAGAAAANGNGNGAAAAAAAAAPVVSVDDLRATAAAARAAVDVPDAVIDLLVGLRTFLQERCEPPVYVSDRRFMKSVSLLQCAAYSDGRDRASEYDCLLLEHVLGSRPDDARKVRAHVLDTIGSDPGLQQAELVLLGLFGRACALLSRPASAAAAAAGADGGGGGDEVPAAAAEAATLAGLLEARHAEVASSLDGGFPELRATLWQSAQSARQAAQHLTPPLAENKRRAEDLLREARVLHACLEAPAPPGVLERMLPKRYKQFVKGISGGGAAR